MSSVLHIGNVGKKKRTSRDLREREKKRELKLYTGKSINNTKYKWTRSL